MLTFERNINLTIQYIHTGDNPADEESRRLSSKDATLDRDKWLLVEKWSGPHSVDLMAVESNAMLDKNGNKLKFFSPFPLKSAAGVNIFSQDISLEVNAYVFPPFCLIFPVLKFLQESGIKECSIVVPVANPAPLWWPLFWSLVKKWRVLGEQGEKGDLLYLQARLQPDSKGLECDLILARLMFH